MVINAISKVLSTDNSFMQCTFYRSQKDFGNNEIMVTFYYNGQMVQYTESKKGEENVLQDN